MVKKVDLAEFISSIIDGAQVGLGNGAGSLSAYAGTDGVIHISFYDDSTDWIAAKTYLLTMTKD